MPRSGSRRRSSRARRGRSLPRIHNSKFTKRVAAVAKRVHYQQTEKKWVGNQTTTVLQPVASSSSGFLTFPAYVLTRGDDNQSRDGRNVMSQGLQMKLNVSNTYPHPFHMRVLLLRSRQADILPDDTNVIININTKQVETFSMFQRDGTAKIDTDLWIVLTDRRHIIWPRGEGSTGLITGVSGWSKEYNFIKRLKTLLTYPMDQNTNQASPVTKNTHWFIMFSFPNAILPIPVAPVAEDALDITAQRFHYFKDM